MKIDNFVRIIDGKLRTTPPIDAFASIHLEASRISHGDLFIDTTASRELIHQALEKGAYAIVTTLSFANEDDECAWIEVTSIEQTLIKLLRYTITQKSLTIVLLSPIQEALLEMIQTPKNIKRLRGNLFAIAKTVLNAKEEERFCLSDHSLAHQIAPVAHKVETSLHVKPTIIAKGLFLSSFWHQDRYFSEQKIPSLFVEELLCLLEFCDTHSIAYSLENLGFCEHFYPQFITHALCKKEFGSSDKALIFEPHASLLPALLAYMQTHIERSHIILALPKNFHRDIPYDGEILLFDTVDELSRLAQKSFQYALILGDKEAYESLFIKTFTTQPSLF
ncbi:hypothetical protein [Sulfurospirillum arsenophilum]|uniref:hypothetical protein n=1 Tax=Sulfurospirillum arsenophilum TaxID=56698 RepID=UPI0005A6E1AA|nr:hypothetical protein [Sulfurospirillum arsenophilum]